jgi:hypothetical protein
MSEINVSDDIHEKFEGSTMSKAGRLAMELAQEKKRLAQELAELQAEAEDLRPTTPTGTIDYYAKWGATFLAVIGIFLMQADVPFYGKVCYLLSSVGWVYVGSVWNDRAILLGSAITATATAMNLMKYFV